MSTVPLEVTWFITGFRWYQHTTFIIKFLVNFSPNGFGITLHGKERKYINASFSLFLYFSDWVDALATNDDWFFVFQHNYEPRICFILSLSSFFLMITLSHPIPGQQSCPLRWLLRPCWTIIIFGNFLPFRCDKMPQVHCEYFLLHIWNQSSLQRTTVPLSDNGVQEPHSWQQRCLLLLSFFSRQS